MATPSDSKPAQVPAELVLRELETILASTTFAGSTRLSRFLRYVVQQTLDGNADSLKEYQLGIEVFDRPETYDTRTDPVVRVEARQLRFKLADYYGGAGRNDQVIISLPKGRYAAHFELRSPEVLAPAPPLPNGQLQPAEPLPQATEPSSVHSALPLRPRHRLVWIWFAAAVAFLIAASLLAWNARSKAPFKRDPNPEARELYLKGRFYWNKRTAEDLNRSIDYFTQAIVKDPGYAQAYVGLADAYNLLSEFSVMPYRDAFLRAIPAAKRAVELDPTSAEAHTALAFSSYWGAWDPTTAEREFQRAIQLTPDDARAHHWYATFLSNNGRFREALAQIEKAQELEPTSSAIIADEGFILWKSGQTDQALQSLKQIEASEPSFISPHRYLANMYLAQRDYPDYLAELQKLAVLFHNAQAAALYQAAQSGYAAGGPHEMLQRILSQESQPIPLEGGGDYQLAQICLMLGYKEKAIHYLNASIQNRETSALFIPADPIFNALRQDPGFRKVLAALNHSLR